LLSRPHYFTTKAQSTQSSLITIIAGAVEAANLIMNFVRFVPL
jgi:hypothetical protein